MANNTTSELARALAAFLDLTGGADGMSCGHGDPRMVRQAAVEALSSAGYGYGRTGLQSIEPRPTQDVEPLRFDSVGREFDLG